MHQNCMIKADYLNTYLSTNALIVEAFIFLHICLRNFHRVSITRRKVLCTKPPKFLSVSIIWLREMPKCKRILRDGGRL